MRDLTTATYLTKPARTAASSLGRPPTRDRSQGDAQARGAGPAAASLANLLAVCRAHGRTYSRVPFNSLLKRTKVLRAPEAITLMRAQIGALLAVQRAPVTS